MKADRRTRAATTLPGRTTPHAFPERGRIALRTILAGPIPIQGPGPAQDDEHAPFTPQFCGETALNMATEISLPLQGTEAPG